MGSALAMEGGRNGAAQTYYQNPNMMMAGNAAQKMIYGHFTLYFKTIVFNPEFDALRYTAGQEGR